MSYVNGCPYCLEKQREIDRLKEENVRLKQKLRHQERKADEGFFGSSTPSSKIPIKGDTPEIKSPKKKGAKFGHDGTGRKCCDESQADEVKDLEGGAKDVCPMCGGELRDKGKEERLVIESEPLKGKRILYKLPKKYCPRCKKSYSPQVPGVLPKSLYGNQLVSTAACMHYLHGVPMGRVCEQLGIGDGSLMEIFHRLSDLFSKAPEELTERYRSAPVKHADETGWRTNGKNGYAWLFATDKISIFQFRKTRSSEVPKAVFGDKPLEGVLVVDRYAGYNKAPCKIQYCYAHLLRDVEDLEKEFPDSEEVKVFVDTAAPLLRLAMGLRGQKIRDPTFYKKAKALRKEIEGIMERPAQHTGIRYIQDIFREHKGRLYHWAYDRRVPADNNLAERDLRPTVIARKTSFGSQSDAGAHTRGVLMTVLHTLKKQDVDVSSFLKSVLDGLAKDMSQDPFKLLFPNI